MDSGVSLAPPDHDEVTAPGEPPGGLLRVSSALPRAWSKVKEVVSPLVVEVAVGAVAVVVLAWAGCGTSDDSPPDGSRDLTVTAPSNPTPDTTTESAADEPISGADPADAPGSDDTPDTAPHWSTPESSAPSPESGAPAPAPARPGDSGGSQGSEVTRPSTTTTAPPRPRASSDTSPPQITEQTATLHRTNPEDWTYQLDVVAAASDPQSQPSVSVEAVLVWSCAGALQTQSWGQWTASTDGTASRGDILSLSCWTGEPGEGAYLPDPGSARVEIYTTATSRGGSSYDYAFISES